MPPSTNHLDVARDALQRTIRELEDQIKQAEQALAALGGKAARRGPGRPRGSASKKTTKTTKATKAGAPRRRRKRRGGTRADQAVNLIEQNPGISASDVAKQMKIKPNYLYRVLSDLEKEGRVKKKGRQYYPAD
jgi:sugar-specific transcriptional regulator TrmB